MARVDTKATIVFTVEAAVLAGVVTALGNPTFASAVTGWRQPVALLGTAASVVAVFAAFLVIIPQLGGRSVAQEQQFLYFGHLRRWEPSMLAERIAALTEEEEIAQLATQLTRLGKLNRRKYVLLSVAVAAALLGALLLVAAFVWPRW